MGVEHCEALTAANLADAGQTVTQGGVITVSSTPISIAAGATLAVVGSITQSLVNATVTQKPFLTFAGTTYTAGDSTDFAIAGQTLTKGGVIKVGETQSSLAQTGTDVVDGTNIQEIGTTSITVSQGPTVGFGGSTYTADPSSNFIIGSQALTKGGIITVQAASVSYAAACTDVVVGTGTEAAGLGGYIMSGLGPGPSSAAPVQFTWKAARNCLDLWTFCSVFGVLLVYLAGRWHPRP